jgi:hypothetical protein
MVEWSNGMNHRYVDERAELRCLLEVPEDLVVAGAMEEAAQREAHHRPAHRRGPDPLTDG